MPLVGIMYGIATIAVAIFQIVLQGSPTKPKLRKRSTDFILASMLFIALISFVLGSIDLISPPLKSEISDFESQLNSLSLIGDDLKHMQKYINDQKERLMNAQKTISELEKERKQLQPVVDSNREKFWQIWDLYQKGQRSRIWLDRGIGLMMGICTSLIASMIMNYLLRRKSRLAAAKQQGIT